MARKHHKTVLPKTRSEQIHLFLIRMNEYKTRTRMILYFLSGSKKYFILSALFALMVSALDLLSPKIIAFTVDYCIGNEELPAGSFLQPFLIRLGGLEALRKHFFWIAGCVALAGGLAALFRVLFRVCNARGAELFTERMRNRLFAHILSLPYAWIGENSTGDIIQRCTSDVQTIKRFVSEQLTSLVRTCILIAMAVTLMGGIDLRVMLVSAAFIPIVVGYSLYFHKHIAAAFQKVDTEEGKLSAIAQENLTGVRVVRAFGRERFEEDRFRSHNEYYTGLWVRLMRLLSAFWTAGDVLMALQILAVTIAGAVFCVQGTLSAGNMIALVSYNAMLTWPVRNLGRVISEMSKAGISIDRLMHIMNAQPEEENPEGLQPPMDGEIVFDHVSFHYPEASSEPSDSSEAFTRNENSAVASSGHEKEAASLVLDDVSFCIRPGSTVGILGGTGSGKSTLMYLLTRLYDLPEGSGTISVGGTDIRQIRLSWLRQNIGMVLQEPFLFSRTLEDNIGFAADAASRNLEAVRKAARTAVIDEAIMGFTDGYHTFVGERGVTLSGGQRQRTAIAQTLIRHTPIMIFDDSLSAVDAQTDRKIRQALLTETENATVIIISHRISTLIYADQILVLEKGKLVQAGTHPELLAQNGLYRKIFELQSAGADIDPDVDAEDGADIDADADIDTDDNGESMENRL